MGYNLLVDSRDVRFVIYEVLNAESLITYSKYEDLDQLVFESSINLAEKFAVKELLPINAEGDKVGARYYPETQEVKVPESYKKAYQKYCETGFLALGVDRESGGMGMPGCVTAACMEYFAAANSAFMFYPGLARGAALLINNFGTEEQKRLYVAKMFCGKWGGTMVLTEPDAGSDIGNLKTKAVRQADGTYLITGQKIFISAAESDLVENIIHPVLARIDGDPQSTKGISIFIVPKYHVNPDGSLGEKNDIVCTGIENKMGLHGSATCSLSLGENGNCVGYLLGEERDGMKIMFQMMNGARVGVGLQGLAISSAAYLHAVMYAKTRLQGRDITQMAATEAPRVAIVQHPDVKRMLLWMKSYVEGMRFLTYFLAHHIDLSHILDGEEAKEANAIVELLTPVCKAGNSDVARLVTTEAMQVHGSYGYMKGYAVEQYARDAKIGSIYEGTNGMQAMDLTFRKILLDPHQYNLTVWKKKISETVEKAGGIVDEKYIAPVKKGIQKLDEVIRSLKKQMDEQELHAILMKATPLSKAVFDMSLAWLHLWSLSLTVPKVKTFIGDATGEERDRILSTNGEAAFYYGKVLASQFWLGTEFPNFFSKLDGIMVDETEVLNTTEVVFTGVPEK